MEISDVRTEEEISIGSNDEEVTDFGEAEEEKSNASLEGDESEGGTEEESAEYSEETSEDSKYGEASSKDANDENRVEELFGHHGGILSLPTHGCSLDIPLGALEEDSAIKITLEVLTEIPVDIELGEDEMVVSPGFKCLPSGLHFRKPVKLIMPHCAVLNDPGKVKTVLHSWSHQTAAPCKEELPKQTCRVKQKELLKLAQNIDPSHYVNVGTHLDIEFALMTDIRQRCHSNKDALMEVFMNWKVKQLPDTDIRSKLADKLEEVGLQELSGKLRTGIL